MPATESTVYQFNIRINDNLFNIYASNGSEAVELLDFFETDILPKAAALSQKAAATAVVANARILAPAATQPTPAAAPPPAAEADAGVHLCAHGQPMKLIPAGISKSTGKPFRAFYACAQPRGMQCDTKVSVG